MNRILAACGILILAGCSHTEVSTRDCTANDSPITVISSKCNLVKGKNLYGDDINVGNFPTDMIPGGHSAGSGSGGL